VPKFASKSSGSLRCSECGKWLPSKETLRFIAEEEVQAGAVLYFAFGTDELALRAPLQGVCACVCVCLCVCVYVCILSGSAGRSCVVLRVWH
jgi:hypothetical protein